MRTIFVINGYPCSGKTTTAKELAEHLINHGHSVTTFSRTKARWEDNMDLLSLVIYKWFNEEKEYLIIDAPAYTVFDRMDLFEPIRIEQEKRGISDDDLLVIAVNMSRSMRFCQEHNNDAGHHTYEPKAFNRLINTYQQPIMAEGFDMVYRVSVNDHINPAHLFCMMGLSTKIDFGELAALDKKKDDEDELTGPGPVEETNSTSAPV